MLELLANKWTMMNAGRGPIVIAPMKLGYRMKVDLRERSERIAYYTGLYESHLIDAARHWLSDECATVLDVGANVGFWTVPLAQAARVIAFEPVPNNAARLRENLALNHVSASTVDVGLSDQEGSAEIRTRQDVIDGSGTGNAAIVTPGWDDDEPSMTIQLRALDELDLDIHRIDLIKVDIEGHEDHFFAGARRTVERHRPVIFAEWNSEYYRHRGVDPTTSVASAFDGLDYQVLRNTEAGWAVIDGFKSPLVIDDLVLVPRERSAEMTDVLAAANRRWL